MAKQPKKPGARIREKFEAWLQEQEERREPGTFMLDTEHPPPAGDLNLFCIYRESSSRGEHTGYRIILKHRGKSHEIAEAMPRHRMISWISERLASIDEPAAVQFFPSHLKSHK